MNTTPDQPTTDDVHGHGGRVPEALHTQATEDDVDGHGRWTP